MDARLRIELFGGLRVQQGERVIIRFRTQKTASLLAYLAYHVERAHSREVLAELLWPQQTPKSGRLNLNTALHSLRKQLEPPGVPQGAVIISDRFSVQLNPVAVTVDVAEFEAALQSEKQTSSNPERTHHLLTAVELYRGELLPGFYDEWIEQERTRLEETYLHALNRLVNLLTQARDFDRALNYARRALNADPLREESHQTLMRLYADTGQPAAAMEHYSELQRLLKEQLNAAPSAATRALARNISEQLSVTSDQKVRKGKEGERRGKKGIVKEVSSPSPSFSPSPAPAGSLPLQFTRFFGREKEIARLRGMLLSEQTRLVTLTGAGGTGKSRLAIEVGARLRDEFTGGVWFVPLADLSDPRLIAGAVRDALRLLRSPGIEPMEQVVNALSRQPALLVLDNFEQLASSGALVVLTLLKRVPSLTCLVTSRRRLNVAGEREFPVLLLPLPEHSDTRTPEHLMSFPSVQLFVDRAQAARPDFQVTKRNASTVAELCRRLEGIPLAIELAAARAQVLTVAQMLDRISKRFDLLSKRRADTTLRHRSLWAAMEWSYQLLSPELQRFFASLSVFRGGWSVEAAERVCFEEGSGFRVQGSEQSSPLHPFTPSSLISHPSSLLRRRVFGAVAFPLAGVGGRGRTGDALSDAGDAARVWGGAVDA